jgi:UDP-GlcNAc:undecaprenyl-phosphate GlcNAc-1-phosphate transferase
MASIAAVFWQTSPQTAIIALAVAAALIAFLIYNFNPASIFMGDCGSLPIGFIIAFLSLYFSETNPSDVLVNFAMPVMLLLVPIFDTTLVKFIRVLSGRKAPVGGKDHASHRLVLMGFSERRAVLYLYGIGLVAGFSALFVSKSDGLTSPAVIIPLVISLLLMGIYLDLEFSRLRDKPYTRVVIEITYRRQILKVILDLCLIAFAYYLSYRLRFSTDVFGIYF